MQMLGTKIHRYQCKGTAQSSERDGQRSGHTSPVGSSNLA